MTVLIHGAACLDNIMFSYDQLSGRPNQVTDADADADADLHHHDHICIQAKLVDFSRVAVSSPVIDVSDFLYSSVHPGLISEHYVTLLQVRFQFAFTFIFPLSILASLSSVSLSQVRFTFTLFIVSLISEHCVSLLQIGFTFNFLLYFLPPLCPSHIQASSQ